MKKKITPYLFLGISILTLASCQQINPSINHSEKTKTNISSTITAKPSTNNTSQGSSTSTPSNESTSTNVAVSTPTSVPTSLPTSTPSSNPTSAPTSTPSNNPTSAPTSTSTSVPTSTPTSVPTSTPTNTITSNTSNPSTSIATSSPITTTIKPTSAPTSTPTSAPTSAPTTTKTSNTSNTTTSTFVPVETEIKLVENGDYGNSCYGIFTPIINNENSTDYIVSYKKENTSNFITIDSELIRKEGENIRYDIVGLEKGNYTIRIEASNSVYKEYNTTIAEYDKSGYAHFNYTNGVGAYKDSGLIKDNTNIVYVTDSNKNTVKATINGKEYTGLTNILVAQKDSKVPLNIRIIGSINTAQWNKKTYSAAGSTEERRKQLESHIKATTDKTNWSSGKLDQKYIISKGINSMSNDINNGITILNGLTNYIKYSSSDKEYDSYFNDLDVKDASNITIEGIGSDAKIFQWGFTFSKCNSIEVRNITFSDYTEDAIGFQGGSNSNMDFGNYWVHNCVFNVGVNNWDVTFEKDNGDGDGATDLKYCHNVTFSYLVYNNTHKTNLIGGSDSAYQYNITLHHNYYNKASSRLPLARQANMHFYNNYYNSCSTAQDIRANAFVLSENNYFYNCKNAQKVVINDTYTGTVIKSVNDYYEGTCNSQATKTTRDDSSLSGNCKPDNGVTNYTNFDTNSSLFYYDSVNKKTIADNMLEAKDVKAFVIKNAGICGGKIYN